MKTDTDGQFFGVLVVLTFAAIVGIEAFTSSAPAQPRRTWTYECFATFGSAVSKLNQLSSEQAAEAKIVGYDDSFLSHCVVWRQ